MSSPEGTISKSKIYTRTGDKGQSSLLDGKRHPKTETQFAAIGDVDECNSVIGVANEFCQDVDKELSKKLTQIESWLFDVGSVLANPSSEQTIPNSLKDTIKTVENWIDLLDHELTPLKSFILPVYLIYYHIHSLEERQLLIYIWLDQYVEELKEHQ